MKRMLWMLAALLMAGCEQSPIEERTMPDQPVEFWATFEGTDESDSRTYLDEQSRMRWTADDRLTIFKKTTYNREFAFTGKTGANAGGFRQVSVDDDFWFGYDVDYNYAIYPHAADNAFDETDCFFTATLPAEQTYVANSFGPGANTMVAVSESGQLLFKNVCSYLRIMLYGADQSVKKITLSSNAGEALAGTAKVYPSLTDDPTCTMVGTTSSIVLNCEEAVTVNATEDAPVAFWIVVPPCTLSEGYKVTVENADGETQDFFVNKEKTFTRNVYSTLKRELTIGQTIDTSSAVPSNQIWYTSSDETMIEPAATGVSVFGATISSHTYSNGLGVITFSGDVTKVGSNAFKAKTKLVTILLPETVTLIGDCAFQNCSQLTDISAPKVTTINSYAFDNCAKLAAVPFASNLTSVGRSAFENCATLESINLENVTTIGAGAFRQCSDLVNCDLFMLKGTLGVHTFNGCSKLQTINIPNGVTEIGYDAFYGCSSLTSITIGNGVVMIGQDAFYNCTSLTSVYIEDIDAWCNISYADKDSRPFRNGATLYLNGEPLTNLVIPDSVTMIGNYAFCDCNALTSITIPNSVTTIGDYAFCNCNALTSITIPSSVTTIGESAFSSCEALKEFKGKFASSDGRCLIVDGELKSFAPAGLTTYTIPNGVTEIGYAAFQYCRALTSVTIPNSMAEIGSYAFSNCTSLTSVTIPDSVTEIGSYAFWWCSTLTSVTIGGGLTTIGQNAFDICDRLTSFYCKATTPPILGYSVFSGIISRLKIYVPASDDDSIITAYKEADRWKNYADYIKEYEFTE